ncbi:MAG TPA: type IV pilin protein [Steroidobacteraceae bacterium]
MSQRIAAHQGRSSGFTLIELMIVMVIAGILLAVAIPSYLDKVRKSRRTEAKTALLDLAGREERFYNMSSPPAYSALASDLGYAAVGGANFPITVGNGYYTVDVTLACTGGAVAPCYTITATPVAGSDQAKDAQCQQYTLTNTGAQTSIPNTTVCWQ